MITLETFKQISSEAIIEVRYKDWDFVIDQIDDSNRFFLQAIFLDEKGIEWKTRKWLLSINMTKSEIVQTMLKCVLAGEEHEARELFLYRGKPVFGPHFDVEKLFELCQTDNHKDARS